MAEMSNITFNLSMAHHPIQELCLNWSRCLDICLQQQKDYYYEFVWFFVIGWIFSQMPFLFVNLKMDAEIKTRIIIGLKISGYVLNLAGILYFLLVVL